MTASPPQVIGTKKKDKEPLPITPRAGGGVNMRNFTRPHQEKKTLINPIKMKPEVSQSSSGDELA